MRVVVDLPDHVWAQLASRADDSGRKVADLIAEKMRDAVGAAPARKRGPRTLGPRRKFTADENAQIRTLAEAGFSHTVIAERFGVNRQTIQMKVARWGLTKESK